MSTVTYVFWTVKATGVGADHFHSLSDCGCPVEGTFTESVEYAGIVEGLDVLHLKLPRGMAVVEWLVGHFGETVDIIECRASVPITCQLIA